MAENSCFCPWLQRAGEFPCRVWCKHRAWFWCGFGIAQPLVAWGTARPHPEQATHTCGRRYFPRRCIRTVALSAFLCAKALSRCILQEETRNSRSDPLPSGRPIHLATSPGPKGAQHCWLSGPGCLRSDPRRLEAAQAVAARKYLA